MGNKEQLVITVQEVWIVKDLANRGKSYEEIKEILKQRREPLIITKDGSIILNRNKN